MAAPSPPTRSPLLEPLPLYGVLRSASLYVGDLSPEVTERDLIEVFSQVVPLLSVRLCRDRVSRKSLCYGYINFFHPSDASKAMACLNHTELRGKPMRIMWCERDPIARKNGIANLYVKNLVPSITSTRLEEMFCKYGRILSCKVAEENGKSKGFGFVRFDSEYSAIKAINALHGTMLEGKKLCVCKFLKKRERKDTSDEKFTNLYVRNLDGNISEELLRSKFSEFGGVDNVVIMKDDAGKSKGFGFVQFNSHEDASKALECLNGALVGSKNLFVARAQKKAEREEILKRTNEIAHSNKFEKLKTSNLYVKNLNVQIDDRKLEELFSPYGKVTSAKVMCYNNGVSKGFGFVCFSRPEDAKMALDSLNGTAVKGMSLYVAFAQSREERSRQFESYQAPYPKESFHTTNWDVLIPRYLPLSYSVSPYASPISLPHFSSFQQKPDQNFGRFIGGLFPCGVQNPLVNFSTYPRTCDTYVCQQDKNFGSRKQQKETSKLGNQSIDSDLEPSSGRSVSVLDPVTKSLPDIYQKKIEKMLHSYLKIQPGYGASKNAGVLLEMERSDMQELLNKPNSLAEHVGKAIQALNKPRPGSNVDCNPLKLRAASAKSLTY